MCHHDESLPTFGSFAEKRELWINFCRFVAMLHIEGVVRLGATLDYTIVGAVEGGVEEVFPTYFPDTAAVAWEGVMDVAGKMFWE